LYDVLSERYQRSMQEQQAAKKDRSREERNTYYLLDPRQVEDLSKRALEELHHSLQRGQREPREERRRYNSAVAGFIAEEVWPYAARPAPARVVLRKLEEECVRKADAQWEEGIGDPGVLAQEIEALRDGKRWFWLWTHAHPLGQVGRGSTPFEVAVAGERSFLGRETSIYWRPDWLRAYSRQEYEETFVRGFIEWERGES